MIGMRWLAAAAALWLGTAHSGKCGLLQELSGEQRREVLAGGQVMLQEAVAGKPWPRVRVFQLVRATPEEVAAVFFDYENSKTYIPDLLHSRISKTITPLVLEVDYEVKVPILADEAYTARNEMRAIHSGGFDVSWILVRALQTKGAEGNLRIEPHGERDSVIRYTNLVTPASGMAKVLKTLALARMQKTVHAIVNKVEAQKKKHPRELARQVEDLRRALASQTGAPAE
jgi:hypothetical protein